MYLNISNYRKDTRKTQYTTLCVFTHTYWRNKGREMEGGAVVRRRGWRREKGKEEKRR